MTLVLTNDRNRIWPGNLGWIPCVDHESGVRVDDVPARRTFKKGPTYDAFRIGECVLPVELLLECPFASPASELTVECIQGSRSRTELIGVALDNLPH